MSDAERGNAAARRGFVPAFSRPCMSAEAGGLTIPYFPQESGRSLKVAAPLKLAIFRTLTLNNICTGLYVGQAFKKPAFSCIDG